MGPPGGMMGLSGGMGGMPGEMGDMGPPLGMMGDPRMSGMPPGGMMHPSGGMMGGPPPGMDDPRHGPYGMGNHNMPSMPVGGMQDPPPGYTQMPPCYPHPHTHPQHPPSPPASSVSSRRSEAPPPRRPSRRPAGEHERIPMGAYATSVSPKHAREPTTAEKSNRGQPANRHVASSGKEWIQGDAFLDACRCTTGCTCRQGHRVLYRSRDDVDSDSDVSSTRPRYRSGEIRYILKTDMGKDCGDHSNCVPKSSSTSSGSSGTNGDSKREKDRKKEDKRRKEEMEQFKEGIVDALSEGIRKARSSKAGSVVVSPRPGFAGLQGGGGGGAFGQGIPDPTAGMGMDPLLAQRMAAMGMTPALGMPMTTGLPPGVNPYAMLGVNMPPGMQDPRAMRPFDETDMNIDMDIDPRTFYARRARGGGGGMRRSAPLRRDDYGSDDLDGMQRRQKQRGKNGDEFGGEF
jgi:hypothetical protein